MMLGFKIFLFVTSSAFAAKRLLTLLRFFQQDEYDRKRFRRWWWEHKVFDRRLSLTLLAVGIVGIFLPPSSVLILASVVFAAFAVFEKDPRKTGKKKLVFTPRAQRILAIALLDFAIAQGLMLWFFRPWYMPFGSILLVQALPFGISGSGMALRRYETRAQGKFRTEAAEKLAALKPMIIAVTGSYGKTSVKHMLGHILPMAAPTLVTPGSVNTLMGISRIVREQLQPQHKFFVVEMGAYGPGSISSLCALTPPDLGIITAVAFAHYERFKSLDTVAQAKYELAHAAAARGGKTIVARGTLEFQAAKMFAHAHPNLLLTPDAVTTEQTVNGLRVTLIWRGETHVLEAPIFGAQQGENIALAFMAAVTLGLSPEAVKTAIRSLPQISHRLEVKAGAPTIIDDAYNSNPDGFAAALRLLSFLRKVNGRRILVTPGMVELGAAHAEKHKELGTLAASCADVVLAVLPKRIRDFTNAFRSAKTSEQELIEVPSFAAAQEWISKNARADDMILLENDLPDLYEAVPRF